MTRALENLTEDPDAIDNIGSYDAGGVGSAGVGASTEVAPAAASTQQEQLDPASIDGAKMEVPGEGAMAVATGEATAPTSADGAAPPELAAMVA